MALIEQSSYLKDVKLSRIREIMNYCAGLEKQGRTILSFTNGEPDFDTPEYIKESAKMALDQGKTGYASTIGLENLRQALVKKFAGDNGLNYCSDEIMITTGVTQGAFVAMLAFLSPGDEVILPDPGFTIYFEIAKVAGAVVKTYKLKRENNFQIDAEELSGLITGKTRMVLLISPSNPIGSVLTKDTLEQVAAVLRGRDILVLSDEVYEKIVFDGHKHYSIAQFEGMRDQTIILNGFSKSHAMTGWRLGYVAAPLPYIDPMMRLNAITTCGVNHFIQWAGVDALEQENGQCAAMVDEFARRRNYAVAEINKIDGLSCEMPEGAFYIFIDVRETGLDSEAFVKYMIDEASVALVPGSAFGEAGEGFVRLCYCRSMEEIEEALKHISMAMKKLRVTG